MCTTTTPTNETTPTSASSTSSQKQPQRQPQQQQSAPGLGRLAVCATGICLCYLSYGLLHERFFTNHHHHQQQQQQQQHLGATFLLVLQCITNSMVAVVWQQVRRRMERHRLGNDEDDHDNVATNKQQKQKRKQQQEKSSLLSSSSQQQQLVLPHRLLLVTAACYVGAMVCSNEAITYVSYPVNVLVKSCKLIPTMMVGQIMGWNDSAVVYSPLEWYAAFFISTGIALFHWDRIMQQQQQQGDDFASSSSSSSFGMMLLLASLTLDGILNAFQNKLKQLTAPFRVPNAVETMLWINLYATMYLIPLAMWSGQWNAGINTLFFFSLSSSTSTSLASSSSLLSLLLSINNSMMFKVALLNATVAVGQIFIFLTITWYTPVITTTITTTRKFLTILLSVWTYGHTFSTWQWTAVVLVFTGLYLAILMVHQKHGSNSSSNNNNIKTKAKTD